MKHAQISDEIQETAALYAAGALTRDEAEAFARHVFEEKCEICAGELRDFQATTGLLSHTAPVVAPSASARDRLMAQARAVEDARSAQAARSAARPAASRWREWVLGLATATAIVGVVYVQNSNARLQRLNDELTGRVASLEDQLNTQRVQLATFTSPEVRVLDLAGQNQNARAQGRIFWNRRENRWLFYAKDLPRLGPDQIYQLWFVPATGNPVSAGIFNADTAGAANISITVPPDIGPLKAAAVTTEPAGGLPQPSGAFALLGAIE